MDTDSLTTLGMLLVLIAFSAFFSASEMALSSVNKMRLRSMAEDGDTKADRALQMANRFDRTLSVILVGNNVVNIAAASAATVVATRLLPAGGVAVSTMVMTVVILIFGEVLPKSIAKENSEAVALGVSGPLAVCIFLLRPIAGVFVWLQNAVSRLCSGKETQPMVTEQELMAILETIEEEGVLDEERSELMQSALQFDETTVQEVLTPRVDISAINAEDDPAVIRQQILTERFSRMPVYEQSIDHIIGILHTRDYLEALLSGEPVELRSLLVKPFFVHKTQRIATLLSEFRRDRVHIAVVNDDFGGTMGIVSLEDLLEELVGEIWDEDEEAEVDFQSLSATEFLVSGDYPILDTLEQIGYEEKAFDTEYTSAGGWALEQLGRIPAVGEEFTYHGIHVSVEAMDDRRIRKLRIHYDCQAPEEE